jgi:hypothetical protein
VGDFDRSGRVTSRIFQPSSGIDVIKYPNLPGQIRQFGLLISRICAGNFVDFCRSRVGQFTQSNLVDRLGRFRQFGALICEGDFPNSGLPFRQFWPLISSICPANFRRG